MPLTGIVPLEARAGEAVIPMTTKPAVSTVAVTTATGAVRRQFLNTGAPLVDFSAGEGTRTPTPEGTGT